ncbi:MAG: F0F1 ATP synthase subunit B [Proteobacteria bacterium]|nr:F0F1 ATP synthase subunit B [Pseudomonadota bacterium]
MLIDWFTVIAQIVNFLILLWLLKRFLYSPILNAIDAREKRIAGELADADAKKAEAQKEREDFKFKNDTFDDLQAGLLKKAMDEVTTERARLIEAARNEADSLRIKQQEQLRVEYENLSVEIARRTRAEAFAIARKALTDLAGMSLEARMVEVFVQRLLALDGLDKQRLGALSPSAPVLVRSAFDLSEELRFMIENAIVESMASSVRFETVPELISGIELIMQGQKVAWSIADYLASIEKSAGAVVQSGISSGKS